MCGITGIIDTRGVDKDLLMRMTNSLVHRGPDDGDIYVDDIVGLGHRRLAILDLSPSGKQPMTSYDGKAVIVFNGEIYNFLELREVLLDKGYKFSTRTDTEVLLAAYNEWGAQCLQKLNGMFAFAIYDKRKKQIFLARDPIGKKPLYYSIMPHSFIFASEVKAFLQDSNFSREIDLRALNHYLSLGYIGDDLCIFKNIRKLPPAHALIWDINKHNSFFWKYWELPSTPHYRFNENELLDELETLLLGATKTRMISDVPLGAFLSGGIDSSLVVAAMSKAGTGKIKTFSVGFADGTSNELPYAKIVADYFNTEHHELIVEQGSLSLLPKLIEEFDEPLADSSIIPTYLVSKATKDYVTVVLSGDGGDELFAGYSNYKGCALDKLLHQIIPTKLRNTIANIAKKLPDNIKGKRLLKRLQYDLKNSFIDRVTNDFFKSGYKESLFKKEIFNELVTLNEPENLLLTLLLSKSEYDFINQLTYTDFLTYLPDNVLVKVDRATMFVALEARAPLLDKRIAEFSFKKVPGKFKLNGFTTKYLLKKLAQRWLPQELDINRKQGFGTPISSWFKKEYQNELRSILLDFQSIYFERGFISKLLHEHSQGKDHGMRLFAILIFILWHQKYCG